MLPQKVNKQLLVVLTYRYIDIDDISLRYNINKTVKIHTSFYYILVFVFFKYNNYYLILIFATKRHNYEIATHTDIFLVLLSIFSSNFLVLIENLLKNLNNCMILQLPLNTLAKNIKQLHSCCVKVRIF